MRSPCLRDVVRRDKIKTQFAADQGIRLLRIPYWEMDNVPQIIQDALTQ